MRDAVRDVSVYNPISKLVSGVDLIVGLDTVTCDETYPAAEATGFATRIILLLTSIFLFLRVLLCHTCFHHRHDHRSRGMSVDAPYYRYLIGP